MIYRKLTELCSANGKPSKFRRVITSFLLLPFSLLLFTAFNSKIQNNDSLFRHWLMEADVREWSLRTKVCSYQQAVTEKLQGGDSLYK